MDAKGRQGGQKRPKGGQGEQQEGKGGQKGAKGGEGTARGAKRGAKGAKGGNGCSKGKKAPHAAKTLGLGNKQLI